MKRPFSLFVGSDGQAGYFVGAFAAVEDAEIVADEWAGYRADVSTRVQEWRARRWYRILDTRTGELVATNRPCCELCGEPAGEGGALCPACQESR
jgi:hypothetical protein